MLVSLLLQTSAGLGSISTFLRSNSVFVKRWHPWLFRCYVLSQQQKLVSPSTAMCSRRSEREGCSQYVRDAGLSFSSEISGDDNDIIYLFPAGATVKRLEAATKHGSLIIVPKFTINSDTSLSIGQFEEVMCHVNKKIQTLRTCLRNVDNELWVCELKEPKLDFQVVDGDPDTEMRKISNLKFNSSEGPLWRARLMPCGPANPCPLPDLRHKFPQQYNLIFAFHHGVNDGLVGLTAVLLMMKLLEDLIKGVPINDEQLGKMVGPSHSEQIEDSVRRELEKDPKRLDTLLKELSNQQFKSLLSEAFGVPEVSQPEMGAVHTILDSSSVNKFTEKCRSAGVTFNSGFTCVINTALIELVQEAGLIRDVYSVTSRHAVDERRYWGGKAFQDFGCHMNPMSHTMLTPHNNRQNFWEYAKRFDEEFRGKLRDKYLFQERLLRDMLLPKDFSYESYFATPPPLMIDYYFSNLYTPNLTKVGIYEHVLMTDMRHHSVFHKSDFSNFHSIGSIQDRIHYDIHYSTSRITHETAHRFHDRVVTVLNDLANVSTR